ncbi:MAG: phage terminase large subunit, partial [Candidatus Bathyarchaeia archaeon]
MQEALGNLVDDPVLFVELLLDFKPFPYQGRLLRDKSKRIVSCMGRQTGKTTTIAAKAIHFAYTRPNSVTLIVSPSLRQSMIMFDRVLSFIYRSRLLVKSIVRKTRTIIQLSNGSRIIALPCSENLLRGYTANLVIVDEAAFMPEEVITQVVFPMLSTTDGYAIFLSTPWGRDHFFYRAFMDPNYSVHRVRSSECPLIKPEFLDEMRRNMTEQAFRMEYEAEFAEASRAYFPQDLIRQCVDPTLEFIPDLERIITPGEYYAGTDFGKLQDFSVITVLKREDNLLKLVYLKEFQIGTRYSAVIGHLVRANQKFQFQTVLVDQTGVGEPVLEELKENGMQNVEGLVFTVRAKEELLSCLKIAMEQQRLRMPYHRRLAQQINEQQYEYSKSGHLRFSHPENSHDDMLW